MASYDALRDYLNGRNAPEVRMSFGAIDELIAGGLPAAAREDVDWWNGHGVWSEAGYEVRMVELDRRMVTFAAAAKETVKDEEPGLELADDGLPVDEALRKTWELAGIGPITAEHVQRFVGGDAEHHLQQLHNAGLLERDGDRYTQVRPASSAER